MKVSYISGFWHVASLSVDQRYKSLPDIVRSIALSQVYVYTTCIDDRNYNDRCRDRRRAIVRGIVPSYILARLYRVRVCECPCQLSRHSHEAQRDNSVRQRPEIKRRFVPGNNSAPCVVLGTARESSVIVVGRFASRISIDQS